MRKLWLVLAAMAALALPAAVSAANGNKLLTFTCDTPGGTATVVDATTARLHVGTLGVDCAGVYIVNTNLDGRKLSALGQVSFAVKGYVGAGSPRISLPLDLNGDGTTDAWAYLSAFYCEGSSAAATGFFVADFTSSSCLIYTSLGGAPFAGLDGLAAAFPGAQVATDNLSFVILDEVGTSTITDVRLGRGPARFDKSV
jgi:hypothetical protein